MAKIGSILTLHSFIWQGMLEAYTVKDTDMGYATSTFTPKSEAELRRVIGTAHRLGMSVIPYISPCYFGNSRVPQAGRRCRGSSKR